MCDACDWRMVLEYGKGLLEMPWASRTAVPGILQGIETRAHVTPRQRATIEQYGMIASEQALTGNVTDRVPRGRFDSEKLPPPSKGRLREALNDFVPPRPRVLLSAAKSHAPGEVEAALYALREALPQHVNIAAPPEEWWRALRETEGGYDRAYQKATLIFDGVVFLEINGEGLGRGQFTLGKLFQQCQKRVGVLRGGRVLTVAALVKLDKDALSDEDRDWKFFGKVVLQ